MNYFRWCAAGMLPILYSAALALAAAPTSVPTSAPSQEQEIKEAAASVLDCRHPADAQLIGAIVIQSDVEREFATEMLKAMRAEQDMFHRAAVAVSGTDRSELVRKMDQAATAGPAAIFASHPSIKGNSATMIFAPAGNGGTTLTFRKVDKKWKFDLLRRYRERGQINEKGIARFKARQQAAAAVIRIYESKQERDFSVIPVLYETMSQRLATEGDFPTESNASTQPGSN